MGVAFKGKHPLFGRGRPLSIAYQQRSPYYWWWQFLRRNEAYKQCCENGGEGELGELYKHFGDVRGDDFKVWWNTNSRGFRLFSEQPAPQKLEELDNPTEWNPKWTKEQVMVVAVPLDIPKRYLNGFFNRLLKKRHKGKRGRKSLSDKDASTALYPLHRNVSIHTLRIQLDVYDAVIKNSQAEKKLTLAEMGAKLKLVATAMPSSKDAPQIASDKRNVMASAFSRYYRAAERIVANTARGQFPNSR